MEIRRILQFTLCVTGLGAELAPVVTGMQPKSGRPGTVVTISGMSLGKPKIEEVYLTDHRFNLLVKILEQRSDAIVIRVPPFAKVGRYQILLLSHMGDQPVLLEQPVYLLIEEGAEAETAKAVSQAAPNGETRPAPETAPAPQTQSAKPAGITAASAPDARPAPVVELVKVASPTAGPDPGGRSPAQPATGNPAASPLQTQTAKPAAIAMASAPDSRPAPIVELVKVTSPPAALDPGGRPPAQPATGNPAASLPQTQTAKPAGIATAFAPDSRPAPVVERVKVAGSPAVPDDGKLPTAQPPSGDRQSRPAAAESDSLVTPIQIVKRTAPGYPSAARQFRVSGAVSLKVTVDSSGAVSGVEVLNGHPMLVPAATDTVKSWQYKPATLRDKPIASAIVVNISFSGN